MPDPARPRRKKADAATKTRAKPGKPVGERLIPEPGQLIVRMYRQGLGDCFLLAVGGARKGDVRYLLIDCGIHKRQVEGTARLAHVMEDLLAATGGHLHVVAATHEHADHLSGFVQKGSPFLQGAFSIDELWLAWTEKDGDRQADALRKKRGTARRVIAKAVQQARARNALGLAQRIAQLNEFDQPADDSTDLDAIRALHNRFADDPDRAEACSRLAGALELLEGSNGAGDGLGAAEGAKPKPSSNELALGLLMALAKDTKFVAPGETLTLDGVDLRAFVLGPPRDDAYLKRDQPSKLPNQGEGHGHGKYNEVYLSGAGANQTFELSPTLGLDELPHHLSEMVRFPFDPAHQRRFQQSEDGTIRWETGKRDVPPDIQSFFQDRYFSATDAYRRIDTEWLASAEKLALNLDGDTNNTSLVLAFEWGKPAKGPILLFPGDAQVGNWLSWRQSLSASDGSSGKPSADDLMRRTLIYKVGHHGSHNATVRRDPGQRDAAHPLGVPFGLELMDDIIALIPVDREAAQRKMPIKWDMPYLALYRRLREKARNRVLRSDDGRDPLGPEEKDDLKPHKTTWTKVPGAKVVSWRKAEAQFTAGLSNALYFDLGLALSD